MTRVSTTYVVLAGLDGTGDLLTDFARRAPDGARAVVIGYPREEALGYDSLTSYVRARLPDERCVVVGESFGGPLAVRLAAAEPDRVRGVVMAASFVTSPLPAWARPLPLGLGFRVPLAARTAGLVVGRGRESAKRLRDAIASCDPRVLAYRMREVAHVDVREAWRALDAAVLAIHAGRDRLIPERCRRAMRDGRPGLREVTIDAPHAVLQLAPDASWRAIDAFARDFASRVVG